MTVTVSIFNNKGGVGKTTTLWNISVSLASKGKNVLAIDFDPQCNLSIAVLGDEKFAECLDRDAKTPFGRTVRAFALPFIQQSRRGDPFLAKPKHSDSTFDIVPGDFWLNAFSDVLNVGTDVIGGSGLYRFLVPSLIGDELNNKHDKGYDYILIDLPPSFNSIVRSALYCSDYFIVPCTADKFSAYCVGLIGEVLPNFMNDWRQGVDRYKKNNPTDDYVEQKGRPKFGGWIFNGFDTRKDKMLGADRAQFEKVKSAIKDNLIPQLRSGIEVYDPVPNFVNLEPIAKIEDMNVMAPDSLVQNVPIKFLSSVRPTRENYAMGTWSRNQIELMKAIDAQYDATADFIISNFTA